MAPTSAGAYQIAGQWCHSPVKVGDEVRTLLGISSTVSPFFTRPANETQECLVRSRPQYYSAALSRTHTRSFQRRWHRARCTVKNGVNKRPSYRYISNVCTFSLTGNMKLPKNSASGRGGTLTGRTTTHGSLYFRSSIGMLSRYSKRAGLERGALRLACVSRLEVVQPQLTQSTKMRPIVYSKIDY